MIYVVQCKTTSDPEHVQRCYLIKLLHKKTPKNQRTQLKSRGSWKEDVRMLFWQISGALWQLPLCYSLQTGSFYCSHSVDCCCCYQSLFSSWCERWSSILDRNSMFYLVYHLGSGGWIHCRHVLRTNGGNKRKKSCSDSFFGFFIFFLCVCV